MPGSYPDEPAIRLTAASVEPFCRLGLSGLDQARAALGLATCEQVWGETSEAEAPPNVHALFLIDDRAGLSDTLVRQLGDIVYPADDHHIVVPTAKLIRDRATGIPRGRAIYVGESVFLRIGELLTETSPASSGPGQREYAWRRRIEDLANFPISDSIDLGSGLTAVAEQCNCSDAWDTSDDAGWNCRAIAQDPGTGFGASCLQSEPREYCERVADALRHDLQELGDVPIVLGEAHSWRRDLEGLLLRWAELRPSCLGHVEIGMPPIPEPKAMLPEAGQRGPELRAGNPGPPAHWEFVLAARVDHFRCRNRVAWYQLAYVNGKHVGPDKFLYCGNHWMAMPP